MKKLLIASAALASTFAFTACSDDSSTSAPSNCSELSKDCLKGTWALTGITGTSGNAGKGTLNFTKSSFTYTPSVNSMDYTYCPNTDLTGEYEIDKAAGTITFSVEGFKMQDCFPDGKRDFTNGGTTKITKLTTRAVMNVEGTTLELTAVGSTLSVFVPNDEAGTTELYAKQ